MVDWGVILGGAGLAGSLVTVIYTQQQVTIARRLAEDAKRMSLLASSHEMLERYQGLRTRWLTHPKGLSALRETLPGLDDPRTSFRFAAERGLLDAEFAKFYATLFDGREPADPYAGAR